MRVGLIGWGTTTGIGMVNWSLWNTGRFTSWIMPQHPKCVALAQKPTSNIVQCDLADDGRLWKWLQTVDAALMIERPFFGSVRIFRDARRHGKKMILVPNHEWLPHPAALWLQHIDHVWCPVAHCFTVVDQIIRAGRVQGIEFPWARSVVGGRWGIDLSRWRPVRRQVAKRFLFSNGNGGVQNRKGIDIVLAAARIARRCQIVVKSQVPVNFPVSGNVALTVRNDPEPYRIYDEGDVCVQPSRWEGMGLSLFESQATAMPLITTDAPPMNEVDPQWRIPVDDAQGISLNGRSFMFNPPNAKSLAQVMMDVVGTDLSDASERAFHQSRRWSITQVVDDLLAAFS